MSPGIESIKNEVHIVILCSFVTIGHLLSFQPCSPSKTCPNTSG